MNEEERLEQERIEEEYNNEWERADQILEENRKLLKRLNVLNEKYTRLFNAVLPLSSYFEELNEVINGEVKDAGEEKLG